MFPLAKLQFCNNFSEQNKQRPTLTTMAQITAVLCCNCMRTTIFFFFLIYTVVQVAGEGGMGEDEVVEVGVLLECWKISSSRCECPGGEVATRL